MPHPPTRDLRHSRLRGWQPTDLDALVDSANDQRVSRYMGPMPYPYTRAEGEIRLRGLCGEPPERGFVWAIEVDGRAVGTIGGSASQGCRARDLELGFWLAHAHWGKGIVSEAIGDVVPLMFRELDLRRISASVFGPNVASARVLEKNGFRLEGTRPAMIDKGEGAWDELLYGRVGGEAP